MNKIGKIEYKGKDRYINDDLDDYKFVIIFAKKNTLRSLSHISNSQYLQYL